MGLLLYQMKKSYNYLVIGIIIGGVLLSPVFVLAGGVCYVDKDVDESGDGSNDKPYKKIAKAVEEDCGEINVAKGKYEENVSLKKGVKLKGNSKDGTIIEGKISMSDGAEISKLSVISGGVDVASGADADIENVRVKGANIGIVTVGGGKLTVDGVVISENRKGMYIQYGKNVKITNCKVYDNKEEGLDIRANVGGSINSNEIYSNGESGIEVILGKSELSIVNNSIKKNGASGIAAQFYSDTDNKGDVNIKNNLISGNKNYGLDCKAPSGGDGKPKGYWADSMDLTSNKVFDNKKNDFSSSCKFDEDKILDATKTKEEREAERLALEEKEKKQIISVEEKDELEEIKVQQEEENRIAQKDREEKANLDTIFKEAEKLFTEDEITENEIKNRNNFLKFLIGEDYKKIKGLEARMPVYDEKIEAMEEKKEVIVDENILKEVSNDISTLQEKREDLADFIQNRNKDFSVWGWLFEKIYLSNDKTIFRFFAFS